MDGSIITIDSCCEDGYGHDTYLRGVYVGCGGTDLGYNDDGGCDTYWGHSYFQFGGMAGVEYKIEWGYYGSGTGTFPWSLDERPAEPGETCENALPAVPGENFNPGAPCWFEYTATVDGNMKIHSCGYTSADTYLEIYDECGEPREYYDDDGCSYLPVTVMFPCYSW
jgi:hypothetical protein